MIRVTASRQVVVVAEDLREEAPEGRDRVEDPVAIADAMLVEGVADAGFGQDVGEREAVVAREAGAELIQLVLGSAWAISGRDDRDRLGGEGLIVDHTLSYDVAWTKVHRRARVAGPASEGARAHRGPMVVPARRSRPDGRIIAVRLERRRARPSVRRWVSPVVLMSRKADAGPATDKMDTIGFCPRKAGPPPNTNYFAEMVYDKASAMRIVGPRHDRVRWSEHGGP